VQERTVDVVRQKALEEELARMLADTHAALIHTLERLEALQVEIGQALLAGVS
jgi:hypothetical protein